jgi:hypothetical protein
MSARCSWSMRSRSLLSQRSAPTCVAVDPFRTQTTSRSAEEVVASEVARSVGDHAAAKNRAHGTKSEDSYPSICPLDRFAIRAPCGAHPAPVASRHASSSIIRSLANLLVTARRLLGAPTCCSTPTAATALPYVTGTKRLERYISADSIKERRWRCAESPSRALWPCGSSSRDQQLSLAHVRVLRYWNRTFARLRRKRC